MVKSEPTDEQLNTDLRYSLLVADTVKIGQQTSTVLTDGCTRLRDVVTELDVRPSLTFKASAHPQDEESEAEPPKKSNGASKVKAEKEEKPVIKSKPKSSSAAVTGTRTTRGAQREQVEQTTAEKIKANQERLHAQRQADGLKKWEHGAGGDGNGKDKVVKRYESYRREEQLPRAVEDRRVSVLLCWWQCSAL